MKILAIISHGKKIGSGHFGRALKFISKFNYKENEILFIFNKKYICKKLKKKYKFDYCNFSSQKLILKKISKFNPDLILIDSYILTYDLKKKIYRLNNNILVIDDNVNQKHICKYYLNYNFFDNALKRKLKQNIKSEKNFIGPKYFFFDNSSLKKVKKINNQVLIFLGSTNENSILEKTVSIIKNKIFRKLRFYIILGNFSKPKIKKSSNNLKFFRTLSQKKYLGIMAKSKYFITSGGVSTWEGLSLKKNMLIVSTADNQVNNLNNLQRYKVINYVGKSKHFDFKSN